MDGPDEPARARLLAAFAVAGTGLWILTGAVLKLLLGTPGDLPHVFRDVPIGIEVTFRLLVGLELFLGLFALLRPARAWPFVLAALVVFAGVLVVQVSQGSPSCGCFGGRIKVPPAVALGIDGALLVLVVASQPWRMVAGGRRDLVVAGIVLAVAAALPNLARPALSEVDWDLKVPTWEGIPISDTPLARFADVDRLPDGLWILYRESCQVCAACLSKLRREDRAERSIVLVRLNDVGPESHRAVKDLPEGPHVYHVDLPKRENWGASPTELVVEGRRVVSVRLLVDCP